ANFANQFEIQVGDRDVVGIALADAEHLATRVAEIALAVELADPPGFFEAGAIDGADKVAVGDSVGRLFQLPEVFGEARHSGRRIENNLSAIQAQSASTFGEVAVIANVDADFADAGVEDWI